MATRARKREYAEGSIATAEALGYFQRKMAFTAGPVELSHAIENGKARGDDEVAPRSHRHAKADQARLLATRPKPHRYTQTRMNRPPPW